MYSRLENSLQLTHVECDGDDVEAHGGVGDAAEGRRLEKQESEIYYTHTHTVNLNSRRGSGVSVSVLRDLSWPLCAGVVCACVAASGEKKSFVLWSC